MPVLGGSVSEVLVSVSMAMNPGWRHHCLSVTYGQCNKMMFGQFDKILTYLLTYLLTPDIRASVISALPSIPNYTDVDRGSEEAV